ncbi:MAG: hypothetical protein J5643_08515 [Lachnospiraceae bacterium]|nr:hypothetical protein [Lachnospiraceae bacterium]
MDNWNQLDEFQNYSGAPGYVQPAAPKPQKPGQMYPNTAYCIDKIYFSMKVMLIATLCTLIIVFLGAVANDVGGLALIMIGSFAIVIASIVAFVNEMLGLNRGKEELDGYKFAFWLIIIAFIGKLVGSYLIKNDIVGDCFDLLSAAASLLMLTTSIKACQLVKRDDVAKIGNKALVMWVVAYALSFVLGLVSHILENTPVYKRSSAVLTAAVALAIAAAVLAILQYVFLYRFFKQAADVFDE